MIVSMNDSLSEQTIREQLTKLLTSEIFVRSARLSRFLQFTVNRTLAGRQSEIKEYVIGVEVYNRRSSYDPASDSIVRTEARRLRGKLKQYYESDGKTDPVRIVFSPGSYIPEIYLQESQVESTSAVAEFNGLYASASGEIVISVDRFVALSDTSQATLCARGIMAEILHLLMEMKGCEIVAPVSGSFHSVHSHLHLDGDIRQYEKRLRLTCRLTSAEGFQLTSHRFDISAQAADSFGLQEGIAAELVSRITAIVRTITTGSCFPSFPRGRILSMIAEKRITAGAASSRSSGIASRKT